MNELLLSELQSEEKDLMLSAVLLEEYIFASSGISYACIDEIIKECLTAIQDIDEPLEQGGGEGLILERMRPSKSFQPCWWPVSPSGVVRRG